MQLKFVGAGAMVLVHRLSEGGLVVQVILLFSLVPGCCFIKGRKDIGIDGTVIRRS